MRCTLSPNVLSIYLSSLKGGVVLAAFRWHPRPRFLHGGRIVPDAIDIFSISGSLEQAGYSRQPAGTSSMLHLV